MRKATSLLLTIAFSTSMIVAQNTTTSPTTSTPNSGTSQVPDPTAPSTTTTSPAPQTNAAPQTSTTTSTASGAQTVNGVSNEIPAGTSLTVRTDTAIKADTQNASTSQTYTGQVTKDILNANGEVLVPRNSPVNLAVYKTGDNEVQLGLQSLVVNGQTYQLNAATQTRTQREGIGKNKRTAIMVGGGAILGTIIGAMAGGAKGAAIGAAVGAGGGAATQVLTRGDKVNVPAETELTFKLDEPIYLQQTTTSTPQ